MLDGALSSKEWAFVRGWLDAARMNAPDGSDYPVDSVELAEYHLGFSESLKIERSTPSAQLPYFDSSQAFAAFDGANGEF